MAKKLLILILSILVIGCSTTNKVSDSESVKDFSKSVGKLELVVSNMETTALNNQTLLQVSLEKANNLDSEIDKLELLFNTYESLVTTMLDQKEKEINSLKTTIEEIKAYEE